MKRLLAAAIVMLAATPAWAQTRTSATPTEGLNEIVITAQRQAQDAQRAPVPLTVLSGQALVEAGVTRAQDLTYLTPGLQVAGGFSAVFHMRGVGNFGGNALQDPALTFNYNGVYIARQTAAAGHFYDLERVEVLKGPQGMLYGRNATGGAINLLPRLPELGRWGGEVSAEYGDYDALRVDAAFNAPLGEQAALRFAAQHARRDGYMNEGSDDQDDWAARLSFLLEAHRDLTIRIAGDYYDQSGRGQTGTPIALGVENRIGVVSAQGGAYYQGQRMFIAGRNWAPLPRTPSANNHHWGASANIEWRTGIGALTLIPAYREGRLDTHTTVSGNIVTIQERNRQTSLEARLISNPHARLETLIGAFYFDGEDSVPPGEFFRPYNQFNFALQQPHTGVESAAIFGRATWSITDRLRATLGARYTEEEKFLSGRYESFQRLCLPVPTANCPNAQPFPADVFAAPVVFPPGALDAIPVFNPGDGTLTVGTRIFPDETARFSRTTWRAALEYDVGERAMLYASYETGFKSGGFFFSNDSQVYRPETVSAFTLGLKSRFLANRLQVNIEAFAWDYEDQQVNKISVDSRGVTNLRTENVGQATIRGVEIGVEYMPGHSTLLSADLHYLDATYDSYTYLTPLTQGPPLSGCPVTPTPDGFRIDCSGARAPYAPEWTLALAGEQRFPLASGANVVANARARYQSETLVGLDFLPIQRQDAYWTLDAGLTYHDAEERYFIGVFGRNLTDETVMANTFTVPFSSFTVATLRPPRTFGVRLGARF